VKYWDYIAFCLVGCYAVFYAAISPGHFQGGDTFEHYQIAKWSLQHPSLLLDHWGKPVFTLLYTLPSQLGYAWAKVFTALIGIAGAVFTFLTAKKLGLREPLMAATCLLLMPMFFVHLNSAMTEILFATWLIVGVYAWVSDKSLFAAIWISFLPFVRTEGFLLMPCFALYVLLRKEMKYLPFLALGSLLYTLIGGLVFGDFLWLIRQNPYTANSSMYGHGSYLHYALSNKTIWGIPLSAMLLVALFLPKHYRHIWKGSTWFWLVLLPFFVVLIFHSVAWGAGKFSSCGELRIMASTAPLAVLLAWSFLSAASEKMRIPLLGVRLIALVILSWLFAADTKNFTQFIQPYSNEQRAIHEVCATIELQFPDQKVWFVDPQVGVELKRDPFANLDAKRYFPAPSEYATSFKQGDILVWDSHFAFLEGATPLQNLQNSSLLQQEMKMEVTKRNGEIFSIYLFQCVPSN
jgi:hypothetical protein